MDKFELLKERIDKFNKDRDWDKFHTPVNLAKSIAIEASELLECFQWSDTNYNLEEVQEELADVLRQLGTRVDDGYEYHFEGECPIIAGYDYDEPCDVVILSVRVDDDGYISLVGDEKNDRGNPHSLDVDEIFAGHLEYVTSYILQ